MVNVDSNCGFTKQYSDLQKLWEKYREKDLIVIGMPSNQFGGQEPGSNTEIKDCWKGFNKATFALNQTLDGILFEPIAKGYRYLPSPIRAGTSNMVSNISNLATIPNNLLQGDFKSAANNTMRLIVNTTLGIVGLFDVASGLGFEKLDKEFS